MNTLDANQPIPFDMRRLILLGLSSLLLCVSFLMSIFTPFPIALSAVLYGRKLGYGIGVVTWLVSLILALFVFKDPSVFMIYTLSLVVSIALSEIILRKVKPLKGMLISGGIFVFITAMAVTYTTQVQKVNIKEVLVTQIESSKELIDQQKKSIEASGAESKEAFEALALLDQPELIAEQVIEEAPSVFFMTTFIVLWVNLFLLLKFNRIVRKLDKKKFGEFELLKIKVPEHFIWLVILSLIAAVWGDQVGPAYPIIGVNLLKCLGIFYFFQGFGIYMAFLDYVKLGGFIRTALVILTVFTASQVIAVIGLFDMFVNFRRFFKQNKNQGEL